MLEQRPPPRLVRDGEIEIRFGQHDEACRGIRALLRPRPTRDELLEEGQRSRVHLKDNGIEVRKDIVDRAQRTADRFR